VLAPLLALTLAVPFPVALDPVTGPAIALAPDLEVRRLADGLWLHVAYLNAARDLPTNGLVVETPAGAVLVDSGWNEAQGARLIAFAEERLHRPVAAVIVTHAHLDRIGGAGAALSRGIPVHSLDLTRQLARAARLPVPDRSLASSAVLELSGERLEVFFPGAGHTRDNATVWLPRFGVLYGGCLVKSAGAPDLGNLADADLAAWPASLARLVARYPAPALVVPGHGSLAGDHLARTRELLSKP